jgi:predicted nucleic acid binding AN1-type Zn finger protein
VLAVLQEVSIGLFRHGASQPEKKEETAVVAPGSPVTPVK